MIPAIIVAIIVSSSLTFYNYYRLNTIQFINMMLTFSLLILTAIVFFFTFDKSSVHFSGLEDIENISDNTFEDIETLTTITKSNTLDNIEFSEDKKIQQNNNKLFNFSFYIALSISILFLILLRLFNKKDFYRDFRNIIYNIVIINIIELYFVYVFKNNYKDQSIEDVRKEIIKKFKDV